jgi:hypothetical protein
MKFTTKVPIVKSSSPIDYSSKIMSLGSCFADNMAEKFDYFKFENSCNPFGILFNPVSIEKIIYRIVNQFFYTEEDIFFHNERWNCFDVHSDLSQSNKEEFLEILNSVLRNSLIQLFQASHIIITYGTSWVYRNVETNEIVANCHKVPQIQFKKELLSVDTITNSIQNIIELVQRINPRIHFIFTVSPVRHLKDGFAENQVSKAHLLSAIYQLPTAHCPLPNIYFPSYEIMMDELRDYRFYAEDMIHPSQMAIDYIWERFAEATISQESQTVIEEVETIQKGLAHRSFNPDSESHQQFVANLNKKINILNSKFPKIQF